MRSADTMSDIHLTELDSLRDGEAGNVCHIGLCGAVLNRLRDLGLIEGTKITKLYSSFCKDPSAYYFRGAVIALRECDAERITVTTERGGE